MTLSILRFSAFITCRPSSGAGWSSQRLDGRHVAVAARRDMIAISPVRHREAHREYPRQVLPGYHLRQFPAKRAVHTREVVYLLELVGLVQNDEQLVIHLPDGLQEFAQLLAGGPRLVRIEEQEDHV